MRVPSILKLLSTTSLCLIFTAFTIKAFTTYPSPTINRGMEKWIAIVSALIMIIIIIWNSSLTLLQHPLHNTQPRNYFTLRSRAEILPSHLLSIYGSHFKGAHFLTLNHLSYPSPFPLMFHIELFLMTCCKLNFISTSAHNSLIIIIASFIQFTASGTGSTFYRRSARPSSGYPP